MSEGIKPWVPPAVGTTKYYDRVAQDLRKRDLDLGNTLDFGAVARQAFDLLAPKKKPRRKRAAELPLPTEEEVTVLNILWTSGPSTSVELYANLDSATLAVTTAENFWRKLHRMAKRGFVYERLVSPQQLMLIGIGPFAVPVEMSAKNRRNRIYRYEPLVDRETLLTLLQSKQWLASQAGKTGEAERISRLLVRVLRGELP
ncbi:MAG: hypothetical protein GXO73_10935 [Calditrichaeota bacterium]|nr:hypothetical protein [Calditrichota bacterium]